MPRDILTCNENAPLTTVILDQGHAVICIVNNYATYALIENCQVQVYAPQSDGNIQAQSIPNWL